jgi:hypothetical protein
MNGIRTGTVALVLALLLGTLPQAGIHGRDTVEAANAARVSLKNMEELVACLEEAHSFHLEWSKGTRADLVRLAVSIESARTLSGETGPAGQEGALAMCRLLRDLP